MKRLVFVSAVLLVILFKANINAQNVEYVGSTLWTEVFDVKVIGNYAYCAFVNGLIILDISNPSFPIYVSQVYLQGIGMAVDISGSYAYVADDYSGLQIINISNPSNPTVAGSYDTPGYARGVYVAGGYNNYAGNLGAFIGGGWGDTANGTFSSIGGGYHNRTDGYGSCIPGGSGNTIGPAGRLHL